MAKNPKFSEYLTKLSRLASTKERDQLPTVTLFWGTNEHLIYKGTTTFQRIVQKWGEIPILSCEGKSISDFNSLFEQRGLFSSQQCTIVRRIEQNKQFAALLQNLSAPLSSEQLLCINYTSTSLPAKVVHELDRIAAIVVPCFDPLPHELASFTASLAQKKQLPMNTDAIDLVIKMHGNDLAAIENCLDHLALLFIKPDQMLCIKDIEPYLSHTKSEHIYRLEHYLAHRETPAALALMIELLRNGEQPTSVLAILAGFVRKAFRVHHIMQSGQDLRSASRHLNLPVHVVGSYINYTRSRPRSALAELMLKCQKCDEYLKSSRREPETLLFQLILEY